MEHYKGEVWISSPDSLQDTIFLKGEIIENVDNQNNNFKVKILSTQETVDVNINAIQKANPSHFDGIDDMASLTYLNEPSVLNNLKLRYKNDKIYTHSGLFLVTVNPYKKINIYNKDFIQLYSKQNDNIEDKDSINDLELNPHIFGTAQNAFLNLIKEKKDQSILVTGESGAGKTENTKKVIQYILSVSTNTNNKDNAFILESQILQANPILESFGNATTVRNLNSSRFGKFIKIQINSNNNELTGAHIDWYLLEKSRVIYQDSKERNYHVFYQLLKGAPTDLLDKLLIESTSLNDFEYLKTGLTVPVENINDKQEFNDLLKAFKVMNFTDNETFDIFKILSVILQLGNIKFKNSNNATKQAVLIEESESIVENISKLLGVRSQDFRKSFLNAKVKIGREIVIQERTASQAKFSIDALSKSLYEKLFKYLVDKINENFKSSTNQNNDNIFQETNDNYIGILDIAGFEIFEKNSFEQLCINYTNEKLQQFFNHHMFELEQSEYMKEGISWNYIDFGNELKPTIELIEGNSADRKKTSIFSILDDECLVPSNTDRSFIDNLFKDLEVKDNKTDKTKLSFRPNKLRDGFIIKHYAGSVDYSVDGWINKNKDPLSSTMVELLSSSSDAFISDFFNLEFNDINITDSPVKGSPRKKTGMFRTVARRHKEQLTSLMDQLCKTYPHFVRCILPNNEKKPGVFNDKIVLHQLRCNGVLEGIRIARSGYPNRIDFETFANHYSLLSNISINNNSKKSNSEYKMICEMILSGLDLDPEVYKIGLTKLFFRNGVLASLEKQREEKLSVIFTKFNSIARGSLVRKGFKTKLLRLRSSKVLVENFKLYAKYNSDPWFELIKGLKPRLDDSQMVEIQYKKKLLILENKLKSLEDKSNDISVERDELTSKLKSLESELVDSKTILDEKDLEIGESRKNIVVLEKKLAQLTESHVDITSILKNKEDDLEKLLASNDSSLESYEKQVKELNETKNKLENKLQSELKGINLLKDEISSLNSTIDKQEMELSSLKLEKKSKDSVAAKEREKTHMKVDELQAKVTELNLELESKSKLLNDSNVSLDAFKKDNSSLLSELNSLRAMKKDYDSKRLAYDQAEKIKKEFKTLKHKFKETDSLLKQKVHDEVEFNEGRQQYFKDLEETKDMVKSLQQELDLEKNIIKSLEVKLQHSQLETIQAINEKKYLETDNSQLLIRLGSINPKQAEMNQIGRNQLSSALSPEIHELEHKNKILNNRVAVESYQNQIMKKLLKKNNIQFPNMSKVFSSDVTNENEIVQIHNSNEIELLRKELVTLKDENTKLRNGYVSLQKDLKSNKGKTSDGKLVEYKGKLELSQIENSILTKKIEDFVQAEANNELSGVRSVLNDTTNVENNSHMNLQQETKLKHENLRLKSIVNEYKTRLTRLQSGNKNRFEQEEEIILLKNNLESSRLKNVTLEQSVKLYKERSDEYFSQLSKNEIELQGIKRECQNLHNTIQHLKAKATRFESQYNQSDDKVHLLNSRISDLTKQILDKDFEIQQLKESCASLKDKYEDSEKLRVSVKSATHVHQETEITRLTEEVGQMINKETEMSKLIKSLNNQLETCRKEISAAKINMGIMAKEKTTLSSALINCTSNNDKLLSEVKTNMNKVKNLTEQIEVLNVSNDNLLKERDNLLKSKRSLEDKLDDIKVKFERHLSKVRNDANNEVLIQQLHEKLEKSNNEYENISTSLNDAKNNYEHVLSKLKESENNYIKMIEDNKELTKYNVSLHRQLEEAQKKHMAELSAQDLHWKNRVNELDSKLSLSSSTQRDQTYQFNDLNRTVDELTNCIKDLKISKKHSERQIKELESTIEKMEGSFQSLSKRELEAQLRCKQLMKECEKYRDIIHLGGN